MTMNLEEARRLYDEGLDLWEANNYEEAARVLKQAAQKTESYKDDKLSPMERKELQDIVLEIWDWCAVAMHEAKKYEDAIASNNRNLSMRLGSPDYKPDDEGTLENRRRLVANYSALGQHDKAIAVCREILKSVDESEYRNNLAACLFRKGDVDSIKEAVNINYETLKRYETRLGKGDSSLCEARYYLGVELHGLQKLKDARDILEENVNILKENATTASPEERKEHAALLSRSEKALSACVLDMDRKEVLRKEKEKKEVKARELKEKEFQEKVRQESGRVEKERLKKERLEKERLEKERLEKEQLEKERLEKERLEKERLEKEKAERRKLEKKKIEKARLEEERPKNERLEKNRREKEVLAKELLEKERIENERTEKERLKKERHERDQRQTLIKKVKDVQGRRDRQVNTGISLGLPAPKRSQVLTPELEESGDLAALETLVGLLEAEVRAWDQRLEAVKVPGPFSLEGREKSPGKSKANQKITATQASVGQTSNTSVPQIVYSGDPPPHTPRRPRSTEILPSDAPDLLDAGHSNALGRSASVGSRNRSRSPGGNMYSDSLDVDKNVRADKWFSDLDTAHEFLEKYKDYHFETPSRRDPSSTESKPYERVKIAILDTGAANSNKSGTPQTIRKARQLNRITWRQFLVDGKPLNLPAKEDEDGHGTQVASILLKVTPYAKIYIYRIAQDKEKNISPKTVAAALEDAVTLGVDIVSMSFGWNYENGEDYKQLRTALWKCISNDVLLFAATSNDGLRSLSGMPYPARADGVIAIDAASSEGEWLPINPSLQTEAKTHRFTALGEAILTDFPPQLGDKKGWERMKGTSAATPIAAGIAALVLEFARQPPLGYAPEIAEKLKRPEAMRAVLAEAVGMKRERNGEYRHLVPWQLFKQQADCGADADTWYDLGSRRHEAAVAVTNILKRNYGDAIVKPMYEMITRKCAQIVLGQQED